MQPAQWNSGMMEVQRSSAVTARRATVPRAFINMPSKHSSAPFGRPVVPEVYWMLASSRGDQGHA